MGHLLPVKGQVAIRKAVRDHLGLTPGAEGEFVVEADGRVVMKPAATPAPPSRFARAHAARNAMTTEEIMRFTRDGA
ncbi:MAG: AbrB/MazE/SpoVT family DNA-binding domain-containing protein [Rubritepida sp.]|nr:AbrB/MazE/SpoVT family DNA-binding domain-containing protein [Rubritepida sp.]